MKIKYIVTFLLIILIGAGGFFFYQNSNKVDFSRPPELKTRSTFQGFIKDSNGAISFTEKEIAEEVTCPKAYMVPFEARNNIFYLTADTKISDFVDMIIAERELMFDLAFYSPGKYFPENVGGDFSKPNFYSLGEIWEGTHILKNDNVLPAYRPFIIAFNKKGNFCDATKMIKGEDDFLSSAVAIPSIGEMTTGTKTGWVMIPTTKKVKAMFTNANQMEWTNLEAYFNIKKQVKDSDDKKFKYQKVIQIDHTIPTGGSAISWVYVDKEAYLKAAQVKAEDLPGNNFGEMGDVVDLMDVDKNNVLGDESNMRSFIVENLQDIVEDEDESDFYYFGLGPLTLDAITDNPAEIEVVFSDLNVFTKAIQMGTKDEMVLEFGLYPDDVINVQKVRILVLNSAPDAGYGISSYSLYNFDTFVSEGIVVNTFDTNDGGEGLIIEFTADLDLKANDFNFLSVKVDTDDVDLAPNTGVSLGDYEIFFYQVAFKEKFITTYNDDIKKSSKIHLSVTGESISIINVGITNFLIVPLADKPTVMDPVYPYNPGDTIKHFYEFEVTANPNIRLDKIEIDLDGNQNTPSCGYGDIKKYILYRAKNGGKDIVFDGYISAHLNSRLLQIPLSSTEDLNLISSNPPARFVLEVDIADNVLNSCTFSPRLFDDGLTFTDFGSSEINFDSNTTKIDEFSIDAAPEVTEDGDYYAPAAEECHGWWC